VKARQFVLWIQERNPFWSTFLGGLRARGERAFAQAKNWLQQDRRRLWGALAVVLAIGVSVAAISSETAGRYGRVIFASRGAAAPLSGEVRRAAASRAKQLAAALDSRLDKKARFAGEAWTSARVLVALREGDPSYAGRVQARRVETYFRSISGPECACWRKVPEGRYPNHLGITAWTLWAFAAYGIPAHRSEIEFLLSSQNREGWWPLFGGANEPRFASTYGTAAAILALHEQSAFKQNLARRERMVEAVKRGANWLHAQAITGRGRWADYPAWPRAKERRELVGVSGFALYVLHRVGAPGLADLDRDWLANLPAEIPQARRGETSGKPVKIGSRIYRDDSLYHGLSWAIAATLLAYPDGSISGKSRAVQWLELALAPGGSIHALKGADGPIAAEALFALRNHPEIAGDK
jgi:hypothetical protein